MSPGPGTGVSEDLFRRQLEVCEKLAGAVGESSMTGRQVSETQKETIHLLREIHDKQEYGRTNAVAEVKEHVSHEAELITERFNVVIERLEFWRKPHFWIAAIPVVVSMIAGAIAQIISAIKK